jgi:tetratricopeptide (TPR) repeat protein
MNSPQLGLSKGASRWITPGICLFLAASTWLVFGQTLRYDFVNYDDPTYVYQNAEVTKGLTIHGIILALTHVHAGNWHPLTSISHMLDCRFYGLNAGGHHFTNVLLHTAAVILLFLVLRQMTAALWPSAFVAALFAIHPLRVESVAWVSERKDVLSGVFFMLTLGAYLRYVRKPSSLPRVLLVVLLFALGLMSKPMLVTMPFVLLLLDYWPLHRFAQLFSTKAGARPDHWWERLSIFGRLAWEKIPLLVLAAVSCRLTLLAQKQSAQGILYYNIRSISWTGESPLARRAINAFVACMGYIWQMIYPLRLAPDYPRDATRLSLVEITFAVALIVFITAVAVILRKTRPYVITGWLWYLGMLVPVIGVINVGWQTHADRYTYLPQIGLYLLITWSIAEISTSWRYRREILGAGAGVIITALTWFAWIQTSYWQDSESLWTHTLAVNSDSDAAHNGLGTVLWEKGRREEAISHFEKAVNIRPWYVTAQNNLARALFLQGQLKEAIAHLQTSLQSQPDNTETLKILGAVLFQAGRVKEAIAQWEQTLEIQPADWEAKNSLAWVFATCPDTSVRDGRRAADLAQEALRPSGGKNPWIFRTLAAAYAESGRFAEAIDAAQRGLELAAAQGNSALAESLRSNIALYQSNSPLRDPSQSP